MLKLEVRVEDDVEEKKSLPCYIVTYIHPETTSKAYPRDASGYYRASWTKFPPRGDIKSIAFRSTCCSEDGRIVPQILVWSQACVTGPEQVT
jgi:hypothetical protein